MRLFFGLLFAMVLVSPALATHGVQQVQVQQCQVAAQQYQVVAPVQVQQYVAPQAILLPHQNFVQQQQYAVQQIVAVPVRQQVQVQRQVVKTGRVGAVRQRLTRQRIVSPQKQVVRQRIITSF